MNQRKYSDHWLLDDHCINDDGVFSTCINESGIYLVWDACKKRNTTVTLSNPMGIKAIFLYTLTITVPN